MLIQLYCGVHCEPEVAVDETVTPGEPAVLYERGNDDCAGAFVSTGEGELLVAEGKTVAYWPSGFAGVTVLAGKKFEAETLQELYAYDVPLAHSKSPGTFGTPEADIFCAAQLIMSATERLAMTLLFALQAGGMSAQALCPGFCRYAFSSTFAPPDPRKYPR